MHFHAISYMHFHAISYSASSLLSSSAAAAAAAAAENNVSFLQQLRLVFTASDWRTFRARIVERSVKSSISRTRKVTSHEFNATPETEGAIASRTCCSYSSLFFLLLIPAPFVFQLGSSLAAPRQAAPARIHCREPSRSCRYKRVTLSL